LTLLRRTPREVYRVYAEDEFFACAVESLADTARLERSPAPRAAARGRTLRRLASSTMLVAAAGALGGLVVLAERSHPVQARRPDAHEVAASDSRGTSRLARPQVWRGLTRSLRAVGAAGARSHQGQAEPVTGIAVAAHRALRPQEHVTLVHRVLAAARGALVAASTAPVPRPESALTSARVAAVAARASDPGQAEFGFERGGRG
jgi:hypothetical protein